MRTKIPSATGVLQREPAVGRGGTPRPRRIRDLALGLTLGLALATPSAAEQHVFRNGRLTIRVDVLGNQYALSAPAAGTRSGVVTAERTTTTLSSLTIPAGTFSVTDVTVPVSQAPLYPTIQGLIGNFANANGTFAAQGGGGFGGSMGLRLPGAPASEGLVEVCVFAACDAPFGGGLVPVGLGVVGVNSNPVTVEDLITYTIDGAPWTLGTATVPVDGGQAQESGSLTVLGDGYLRVRLVTPISIELDPTGLPDPFPSQIAAWGLLTLEVPEPDAGTAGLAALAALVVRARRRARTPG